jgi:hypothetical protein
MTFHANRRKNELGPASKNQKVRIRMFSGVLGGKIGIGDSVGDSC